MVDTKERKITLTNHKTAETKDFVLRPFLRGDADSVIEYVREEYGDTYYRREYYDRELLSETTENGELLLFLACCGDELCGIQSIIHHPGETRLEAASQIFRKAFRGYGLPYELVKYTYMIAGLLHPSCIYASTVVFHNITQKMCEKIGMTPVAFNFGSHLTSKMSNSFMLGSSEKYAQAILIMPIDKRDAGNIYIHRDIERTVERLYRALGVDYNIISAADPDHEEERTDLTVSVNDREESISILIRTIGRDLMERIRDILAGHSGKYWTTQLILPVNSPCALSAYEELSKEGFFFTGIRALCSGVEQIYMQYTGKVYFNFEEYVLTDTFKELLDDVLLYYKKSGSESRAAGKAR